MPGSDRDPEVVQHLPDIVRVDAVHLERDRPAAVPRGQRAEDAHPADLAERADRVRGEVLLVSGDRIHAERVQVVAGSGDADRLGGGRNVDRSMCTTSIIEPPVMNGGIAASSSARPQSTPMPLGPSILCAENARKSAPSAVTSTGRCGTSCAPSHTTSAPAARASAATCATGGTSPVTLDCPVIATTFVRSPIISAAWLTSTRPSPVTPSQRRLAPVRWQSCCQGTRFAWCSASVTSTSSPGPARNLAASGPAASALLIE